jgi:hypothetical protein
MGQKKLFPLILWINKNVQTKSKLCSWARVLVNSMERDTVNSMAIMNILKNYALVLWMIASLGHLRM